MSLYDRQQSFLTQSRQDEIYAAKILSQYGITSRQATKTQDTQQHKDIICTTKTGKIFSADIKGKKPVKIDGSWTLDHVWIETQNVKGQIGWVYGQQDIVIWVRDGYLILVSRQDLATYITQKIQNLQPVSQRPETIYTPYQRLNRHDIVTAVPMADILKNCKHKILKETNI